MHQILQCSQLLINVDLSAWTAAGEFSEVIDFLSQLLWSHPEAINLGY